MWFMEVSISISISVAEIPRISMAQEARSVELRCLRWGKNPQFQWARIWVWGLGPLSVDDLVSPHIAPPLCMFNCSRIEHWYLWTCDMWLHTSLAVVRALHRQLCLASKAPHDLFPWNPSWVKCLHSVIHSIPRLLCFELLCLVLLPTLSSVTAGICSTHFLFLYLGHFAPDRCLRNVRALGLLPKPLSFYKSVYRVNWTSTPMITWLLFFEIADVFRKWWYRS